MSYFHLPSSTERSPGRLETKLSDGAKLGPPETGWTDALAALCGFVQVAETSRPANTATDTFDRTVTLVGGVPTVVWVQRPWTADELTARTGETNSATIKAQARNALTLNATYLAIGAPTNAQTAAQVRALTQQVNGVIRLSIGALDATT